MGLFALLGFCALAAPAVSAEDFPRRPITLVVPFAAGGAADVTARIVADGMGARLGQPVIVENVAGAGGTTGTARVKNAARDGYTLGLGHLGTHAAAVGIYPKLPYDPVSDFEPLGLVTFSPSVLFVRKDFPGRTLGEFLDYARAKGDKITFGHSGAGSISHITCGLLSTVGHFKPTQVAYRGNGPMVNDMLGGTIDYSCDLVLAVSPQITSGNLRAIVVAAQERSPVLPDVPTSVEAGLPAFQATTWTGIFAPKGTPREILAKLRAAMGETLDDPRSAARLVELGAVVPKGAERTPEYLTDLMRTEIPKWTAVAREAGLVAR